MTGGTTTHSPRSDTHGGSQLLWKFGFIKGFFSKKWLPWEKTSFDHRGPDFLWTPWHLTHDSWLLSSKRGFYCSVWWMDRLMAPAQIQHLHFTLVFDLILLFFQFHWVFLSSLWCWRICSAFASTLPLLGLSQSAATWRKDPSGLSWNARPARVSGKVGCQHCLVFSNITYFINV